MSKTIMVDIPITQEGIDRLKRIEKKQIRIPHASGKGKALEQIKEMAELMKDIYEQTQRLISATATMLEEMNTFLSDTDNRCANAIFRGNGSYRSDIIKSPMDGLK